MAARKQGVEIEKRFSEGLFFFAFFKGGRPPLVCLPLKFLVKLICISWAFCIAFVVKNHGILPSSRVASHLLWNFSVLASSLSFHLHFESSLLSVWASIQLVEFGIQDLNQWIESYIKLQNIHVFPSWCCFLFCLLKFWLYPMKLWSSRQLSLFPLLKSNGCCLSLCLDWTKSG